MQKHDATNESLEQVARSLAEQVAELTGQTVDETIGFATEFAPSVAKWGLRLADAQDTGDDEGIAQQEENLALVRDLGYVLAGEMGVRAQSIVEGGLVAAIRVAARFARAAVLPPAAA